jgi:hypothetical protein
MSDAVALGFIIGTGRCGSTLAHEILARHRDVAFLTNLEDRAPALRVPRRTAKWLYNRLPPTATTKGRMRLAPSEGYRLFDRRVSRSLSTPFRDLTAVDATPWLAAQVRSFFDERAGGSAMFVHKFTGWPRAGFLHQVDPTARFVHIVRDGRAVANSWLKMPWWHGYEGPERWQFGPLPETYREEWEASGRSFTLLAGLAWKLLIDAFDEARRAIPPDAWLEIRYEDLVADPRATTGRMLSFLGLEWNSSFEAQFARHAVSDGGLHEYRRDLDPASLALLDTSLGLHLQRHGYELGNQG